jgi:hypothetical protein
MDALGISDYEIPGGASVFCVGGLGLKSEGSRGSIRRPLG